jgi:hypothetical protein
MFPAENVSDTNPTREFPLKKMRRREPGGFSGGSFGRGPPEGVLHKDFPPENETLYYYCKVIRRFLIATMFAAIFPADILTGQSANRVECLIY